MIILTATTGRQLIIAHNGVVFEPEPDSDGARSVVTLPHTNRDGKAKFIVQESFVDIEHAMSTHDLLIRVSTAEQRATESPFGPEEPKPWVSEEPEEDFSVDRIKEVSETALKQPGKTRGRRKAAE